MKSYAVLFIGVLAISFAAIFIRLAEAPALVIAAYRLSLASLTLAPLAWWRARPELQGLSRGDLTLALASGLLLALHFALWITSLQYTSVASSVVLVTTTPLFVGLFSHWTGEERLVPRTLAGIAVSLVGGVVIGWGDFGLSPRAALGDLLALMGAMAAAGYFLAGRRLRARLSLLAYTSAVYSVAALALLTAALGAGQAFLGYSSQTYAMFLLLALVPQLLGHSSLNWALRYVSATFVTIAVLGEPVGATLLAYFILQEVPTTLVMTGGGLVLLGIYIALRGRAGFGLGRGW